MAINDVVEMLLDERKKIDEALKALGHVTSNYVTGLASRIKAGGKRAVGMQTATAKPTKKAAKKGKRVISPEARAKMAEAARKRWAERKKTEKAITEAKAAKKTAKKA